MATRREPEPPPGERRRRWPWGRGEPVAERTGRRHAGRSAASEQERLILEALQDLRDMDVREVMTPRVDVTALTIPVLADDVARAVRQTGHSCFPVVDDDLDDLVGILYVNDLFRSGQGPGGDEHQPGPLDISRRLRPPYLIPESRRVLDALAEMRRQHRAFAVVVDEYGGVAGVLTVKDLLEPLVGDLHDEFDPDSEPDMVRVDRRRWLVDGRTSVDDVRERLHIPLPDGEYVTLGGYLFDAFGHIPETGEALEAGDWELRVVEMDKRRIAKVVARDRSPDAEAPDGPETDGRAPTRPPAPPESRDGAKGSAPGDGSGSRAPSGAPAGTA